MCQLQINGEHKTWFLTFHSDLYLEICKNCKEKYTNLHYILEGEIIENG